MKRLLLLACLALTYSGAANAEPSLRCNGRLLRIGVPAAYVLAECGAPASQTLQETTARAGTVVVADESSRSWLTRLRPEDGGRVHEGLRRVVERLAKLPDELARGPGPLAVPA